MQTAGGSQAFPLPQRVANGLLTRCAECRGLRAELEVARLDARQGAAQLAAAQAAQRQTQLELEGERATAERLRQELLAPRDVTVAILREQLALSEQRLELARDRHRQERADAGQEREQERPIQPAPRPPYPQVPLRRAGYPMQVTEVGFAESLFVQYADAVDMTAAGRAAWVTDGRVTARFHLTCMQALATHITWRQQHLTPPDGEAAGRPGDFFFWKMQALGLALDLVATVDGYVTGKLGLGGGKSHVSQLQLRQGVDNYHLQRRQFYAAYEASLSDYLSRYAGWPPAREYGKTVPAQIYAESATGRGGRAAQEAARQLAEAAQQGSILVDASQEGRHLFLGSDAVLSPAPAQPKRKKPPTAEGPLTARRRQDEELARDSDDTRLWF